LLLGVPFFDQIFKEFSKAMVTHQVAVLEFMVADRALVLAIDYLGDAGFAEGMAALSDVRIIVCLEADDALCKLSNDVVDADLYCFIVFRLAFL
jgi:hypothetical protein